MRSVEKPLSSGESVLIPRKGSLNHVMYVDEDFWTVDTMFFTIPRMPGAAKYAYQYVKGLNLASMNAGSAVPSMTVDILNGLQLAIPCKEALAELDSELQPTYSLIAQIRAESKVLVELRDSLLPKLMSGEIDTSKIDLTQLNSHLPRPFPTPICCFLSHAASPRAHVPLTSIIAHVYNSQAKGTALEHKNAWLAYDEPQLAELEKLATNYIDFISANKTERECVATAIEQAREAGYVSLDEARAAGKQLVAGDKVYAELYGKTIILAHIGSRPMTCSFISPTTKCRRRPPRLSKAKTSTCSQVAALPRRRKIRKTPRKPNSKSSRKKNP